MRPISCSMARSGIFTGDGSKKPQACQAAGCRSGHKKRRRQWRRLFVASDRRTASRPPGVDSDDFDVLGLRALLPLADRELDALTFGQGLETGAGDGAEVSEDVGAGFLGNEAEALGFVEP